MGIYKDQLVITLLYLLVNQLHLSIVVSDIRRVRRVMDPR